MSWFGIVVIGNNIELEDKDEEDEVDEEDEEDDEDDDDDDDDEEEAGVGVDVVEHSMLFIKLTLSLGVS
jgi:hypothetical protein